MQTAIRFRSGVSFDVEARGHRFVCDQPITNGGADEGPTPPELMLASLGTCAAFYVVQYLNFHTISSEGLTVSVEADKALQPARLGAFRIRVEVPRLAEQRHVEGARRAAEKCLIHNTLMMPPALAVEIVSPVAV